MRNFKKSEIAAYAIALMLVAAGYFNYSTFEQKTEEVYSEDIVEVDDRYANVGDAVLVSNNEIVDNGESSETADNEENNASVNDEKNSEEVNLAENNEQISEEVNIVDAQQNESDYYVSSKLDRDKMYAEMISNYENILNNSNVSEAQKSIATQEITKINNTKNAIMICENLILTKGFKNCVIFVNDRSVNVVTNIEKGLTKESVAKVQNIISRELGTEIENIHITEK